MYFTLTQKQARQVDQIAMEQFDMPSILLMENAGSNAASFIHTKINPTDQVAILCGSGNNGGDGYVIARYLMNRGIQVQIICAKPIDELAGDAAINANIALKMQIPIIPLNALKKEHVVIDALLGTGFEGKVRKNLIPYIQACENKGKVFAIDIPSGLICDTGEPGNATVKADYTVTFVARKQGFENPSSEAYTGQVQVVEIGVPLEAIQLAAASEK